MEILASNASALHLVSFCSHFFDKEPIQMPFNQVMDIVLSDPDLKRKTEICRYHSGIADDHTQTGTARKKAKDEYGNCKKQMPIVIPSAICENGKNHDSIVSLAPFMATDQDHLTPEQVEETLRRLSADPYSVVAIPTPSGTGVRNFMKIANIESLQKLWDKASKSAQNKVFAYAYQQVADYVKTVTGIDVDMKCANAEHGFTIVHAPEAHYNPDATPFTIDMSAFELPSPGRPGKKSSGAKKAHQAALDDVLDVVLQALADAGIQPENGRNDYLHRFASHCNHYGVVQDEVTAWAMNNMLESDFDAPEIDAAIASAYKRTDEHGVKSVKREKASYCSYDELEEFIRSYGEFRYNAVKLEYEVKTPDSNSFRPKTDEDKNEIYRRVLAANKLTSTAQIRNIIHSMFSPHFHPYLSYFASLPPCTLNDDGTCMIEGRTEAHDYIAEFASRVQVEGDQKEFLFYFRLWFVSVVKSMGFDNEVNHHALGFFGKQGIYKTTFFRMLLPPELRNSYFYLKTSNVRFDKDEKIRMATNALICLEEMDTMAPAEMNQLKALFTTNTIDERPPFGRNVVHLQRNASFCMTGNEPLFLTDTTGSRRFFPFIVEKIEDPRTFSDYEALYAQAWALAQPSSGYRCYISCEEITGLNERNKAFMVPILEHELIDKYIQAPFEGANVEWESAGSIKTYLERYTRERLDVRKIGAYLRKNLGIKPKRTNTNNLFPVIFKTEAQVKSDSRLSSSPYKPEP